MSHDADRRPDNAATKRFASFVSRLSLSDVPVEVVEHAKWDILDSIGCALYSQTLPIARMMRDAFAPFESGGSSLVWGTDWRLAPDAAALVNATLVHAFELDDVHTFAIMHPGGVSLAPAIALGALNGRSGADVVAAHIAGIEVCTRIGVAIGRPMIGNGWHNLGTLGVLASAASSARVLQLSQDHTLHALGTAGSLASGLMSCQYGSMVKRLHAGNAAQAGVRSAMLARQGFSGIEALLEEPYGGYISNFAGKEALAHLDTLGGDFGSRWETLRVGFKPYAACASSFTTVDTLIDLHALHDFDPSDVEQIEVKASSATKDHVGWDYVPNTITTAQMNLGYAAAIALIEGKAGVGQFRAELLGRADIVSLAHRTRVTVDPSIDDMGPSHRFEVQITITMRDGTKLEGGSVAARGSSDRPMTEDERREKFFDLSTSLLSNERSELLFDAVMNLDQSGTLDELHTCLGSGAPTAGAN